MLSYETTATKRIPEDLGTAASDLLQGRPNPQQDTDGKVELSEGQYQDPTWREEKQDGGDLDATVPDGNSISPPQCCYHPQQDYPGPGPVHGNPAVWDDEEPGHRRSATNV